MRGAMHGAKHDTMHHTMHDIVHEPMAPCMVPWPSPGFGRLFHHSMHECSFTFFSCSCMVTGMAAAGDKNKGTILNELCPYTEIV